MKHVVEPATPEEHALVIDAWARSFRNSKYAGCIANDEYPVAARNTIRRLIDRSTVRVVRNSGRVLGFAVQEDTTLHYVYTKRWYRGTGVARSLVEACGHLERFTHRTDACDWLFDLGLAWDPVPARV